MLGALPFHSVRQQHDQATEPLPFVLGAGNELIDDRLGGIPEIAKLGLPQNQTVGTIKRVTVFESQHTDLRQRAVNNLERRLVTLKMLQWRESVPVLIVMKNCVSLAKGP